MTIADYPASAVPATRPYAALHVSGSPKNRLYRRDHATFEDYCKVRWGMNRDYANKLIASSETVEQLKMDTKVSILPANERQARELARLDDPEERAEVWQEIVGLNRPIPHVDWLKIQSGEKTTPQT